VRAQGVAGWAFLAACGASATATSKLEDRIKRDELGVDDGNSPHMARALRMARETLPSFWRSGAPPDRECRFCR